MESFIKLIRIKHWAKNLFIFLPLFFAGELADLQKIWYSLGAFIAFSLVASSVYIMNDYRDIEADKLHPEKKNRPLASGAIKKSSALIILLIFVITGFSLAYFLRDKFMFVLGVYFLLNVGYSYGLKNIGILDLFIVAAGFNLRVKAGGIVSYIPISEWLMVMIFLLALFLGLAKRRDDLLIKKDSGQNMRKSVKEYNLDFINASIIMVSGIIIVAYLMYTVSPAIETRFGTHRIYYTTLFVIGGILRYLQLVFVSQDTGSPTKVLYKDRFIQASIILWMLTFYVFIYWPDFKIFQ